MCRVIAWALVVHLALLAVALLTHGDRLATAGIVSLVIAGAVAVSLLNEGW